jgi:hypothetical protein
MIKPNYLKLSAEDGKKKLYTPKTTRMLRHRLILLIIVVVFFPINK